MEEDDCDHLAVSAARLEGIFELFGNLVTDLPITVLDLYRHDPVPVLFERIGNHDFEIGATFPPTTGVDDGHRKEWLQNLLKDMLQLFGSHTRGKSIRKLIRQAVQRVVDQNFGDALGTFHVRAAARQILWGMRSLEDRFQGLLIGTDVPHPQSTAKTPAKICMNQTVVI